MQRIVIGANHCEKAQGIVIGANHCEKAQRIAPLQIFESSNPQIFEP
jgi:hypothetical protein